jgi:hypothetical protein
MTFLPFRFGTQAEVSGNSGGEAAVSGILFQREAELAGCGAVERPPRSNPASNVAFADARCRCDCESQLKMEIPAETVDNAARIILASP